jgi:hypothetical protein
MALSLDTVAAIARALAGEHAMVRVLGVASIRGGTDRVELLIDVTDRHQISSLVMLNVSRVDSSQLTQDIRAKLRDAVTTRLPRS